MKKILISLGLITFTLSTFAADLTTSVSPYKNTRGMAMGNTYVSSAIDETALLYNPAMLNVIEKHKFSLASVSAGLKVKEALEVSDVLSELGKAMGTGGKIEKIDNDPSKTPSQKSEEKLTYINDQLNKIINKDVNGYIGNFTGFVVPNFGLGIFSYANVNKMNVVIPAAPELQLDATFVIADAPIGFATEFGPLSVGVSARYINNVSFKKSLASSDLLTGTSDSSDKKLSALLGLTKNEGFGVNIGTSLNVDTLRLGLSVQDIYSKIGVWKDSPELDAYGHETNSGKYVTYYEGEKTINPNLRAGFAWTPTDWLLIAGDVENLLNKDMNGDGEDDKNIYKKIHLGSELKVFDWGSFLGLTLRGGFNQGYGTYGGALKALWIFELEYASYTEESGGTVGTKPNEIDSLAFTIRF